jgi:hypothetical protein
LQDCLIFYNHPLPLQLELISFASRYIIYLYIYRYIYIYLTTIIKLIIYMFRIHPTFKKGRLSAMHSVNLRLYQY